MKTQIVTTLRNLDLNCDKTQTFSCDKTENSISDKTKNNQVLKKPNLLQKVFRLEQFDTLTKDEMYLGQPVAIPRCFKCLYLRRGLIFLETKHFIAGKDTCATRKEVHMP